MFNFINYTTIEMQKKCHVDNLDHCSNAVYDIVVVNFNSIYIESEILWHNIIM